MGAGAALPIDESRLGPGDVGEASDVQRISRRDDEPLRPSHEMDQALNARLEPGFVFRENLVPQRVFREVEAGDLALRLAQRDDALEAAHEPDVELGPRPGPQQVPQFGQHQIVAGVNAERGVRLVENLAELLFDLGCGALQMRR
jgi:hypothetical protein